MLTPWDTTIGDYLVDQGEVGCPEFGIIEAVEIRSSNGDGNTSWNEKRDTIIPPPGQGPVLGLYLYQEDLYVFRRKESPDDTEVGMYIQHATTGWAEIDTSALVITYDATQSFEFITHNFYATSASHNGSESMFWVDSFNKGRYYNITDGVVVMDNTGMGLNDKPTHLEARGAYLFMSYGEGSLQHCAPGDPDTWDGTVGASEIGFGKEITGIHTGIDDTLIIFMTNGITVLTGGAITDWSTKVFSRSSGAYPGTIQRLLGTSFFMDDRGITTLEAVDTFGDYAANSISSNFKKTLLLNRDTWTCSYAHRDLNQYRIYFGSGLGIVVSFKGKELIGTTYTLYPINVSHVTHGAYGTERGVTFFASDSTEDTDGVDIEGYIYRMDSGLSFDSQSILTRGETAYYHYGTLRSWKSFISCTVEANTPTPIPFNFKIDFDYGDKRLPLTEWLQGSSGYSGTGTSLYAFAVYGFNTYGGSAVTFREPILVSGYGTNMSIQWTTNEAWNAQHSLQNVLVDYENLKRRI